MNSYFVRTIKPEDSDKSLEIDVNNDIVYIKLMNYHTGDRKTLLEIDYHELETVQSAISFYKNFNSMLEKSLKENIKNV